MNKTGKGHRGKLANQQCQRWSSGTTITYSLQAEYLVDYSISPNQIQVIGLVGSEIQR